MFVSMPTGTWSTVQLRRVPPPSAAEQLAVAARRRYLGEDRASDPIADVQDLLAEADAKLDVVDLGARNGGLEAALMPAFGGFRVLVDPTVRLGVQGLAPEVTEDLGRQRLRFRVLHELAHTFFYDRSEVPSRVVDGSAAQEAFCDRFAACFLLPTSVIADHVPSPHAIATLQARYDVSMQLCVRRFAEVHRDPLFALLAATGRHEPRLRTQWVTPSRGQTARWWTAEWIQDLLFRPTSARGTLRGHGGDLEAEALAFPSRAQVVVVGLAPKLSS